MAVEGVFIKVENSSLPELESSIQSVVKKEEDCNWKPVQVKEESESVGSDHNDDVYPPGFLFVDVGQHPPQEDSKPASFLEKCSWIVKSEQDCTNVRSSASLSIVRRPYSCDQCSAQFKQISHYKQHLVTHSNLKQFACDQCPARFNSKSNLKKHAVIHTSEQPFACLQCSARFNYKSNLKKHLLSHSNERSFSCNLCSARFKSNEYLKQHAISHVTEKSFTCNHCSTQFKTSRLLKCHLLTHTTSKPYSCSQCSAPFKHKSSLRRHLVTHACGEQEFVCEHCSAKFNMKSKLEEHVASHNVRQSCAGCLQLREGLNIWKKFKLPNVDSGNTEKTDQKTAREEPRNFFGRLLPKEYWVTCKVCHTRNLFSTQT